MLAQARRMILVANIWDTKSVVFRFAANSSHKAVCGSSARNKVEVKRSTGSVNVTRRKATFAHLNRSTYTCGMGLSSPT